jgi:MOSC domain-containing protein YiiM
MRIISVNIGKARSIRADGNSKTTGIFKLPVDAPLIAGTEGLPGDDICSTEHHGGPDQAIYIYGQADYDWWARELGREMTPGLFGENVTVTELESTRCNVGDRLVIGDVVLEVTSPRIPCATFAAKMEDTKFIKRFRHAERPGFYCRVIRPGPIKAGDEVRYEPTTTPTVSILEIFRDYYEPELTETAIRRFLDAPIAIRARAHKERQLDEILKL